MLEMAGWEVQLADDVCCGRSLISKGLLDAARSRHADLVSRLSPAALAGMNAGALGAHAQVCELVADAAREATAVAQALGYAIDAEERIGTILAVLERAGPTKGSMLQDFEAGRRTEIDVINGAVVKAADEQGVAVPLNRAFVALVKGWESMRGLA